MGPAGDRPSWRTLRPRVLEVPGHPGMARCLQRLRDRRGLVALDSAGGWPRRFGLIGFDPLLSLPAPGVERAADLAPLVARLELAGGDPLPGPFHGGFIGALAYDLGAAGERPVAVAPEPWGQPLLVGGLYADFLVRDERARRTYLVLSSEPGDPSAESRARDLLRRLAGEGPPPADPQPPAEPRPIGPLVRRTRGSEHRRRVQRARELIARGDLYQANLAHRFTRRMQGHPLDLYLRLRRVNPAPYMGFLAWEGRRPGALLSASPELLLEYDGELARTRPIKGTIARGRTEAEDALRAAELLASDKDLAELTMIVDLARNDLGRVARPGGVRVEDFPRLQTYPGLHHLAADVVAEPRAGVGAIEILESLFPGGSVTGAPKLRSMEVIAELEGEGRGFFTGSMGYLDARGRAAFNILIRTLLWRPRPVAGDPLAGEVSFRVGGGITWSSDPAAEERETLVKAQALVASLAAPGEEALAGAGREAAAVGTA